MSVVRIVEVGLRDGLQNKNYNLSLIHRYNIVKKLSACGLKKIELGSFVSPKAIPQMKCVPQLVKQVMLKQKNKVLPQDIIFSAFIPNQKGFQKAVECGLKEVSYFVSCTESFSRKNINMSIQESLKNLSVICQQAKTLKIKVRVYLSVAFFCPYEGKLRLSKVVSLVEHILNEGVFELSVSDTIGMAVYTDVLCLMKAIQKKVPIKKIALHFHDTRGMALANVIAGLQTGVRVFDSSIGGLGGCPYASGASGNVATEDLVYFLEKMKFKTRIQIPKLIKITQSLEKILNHSLPSKIGKNNDEFVTIKSYSCKNKVK